MAVDVVVQVANSDDIVVARQAGRDLAESLGFSLTDLTLIATAISEVARNITSYTNGGEVRVSTVDQQGRIGLVVEAVDFGPGIADIDRALEDGYSTRAGMGLGLPGARRLMDEFEIHSAVGRGTHRDHEEMGPDQCLTPAHPARSSGQLPGSHCQARTSREMAGLSPTRAARPCSVSSMAWATARWPLSPRRHAAAVLAENPAEPLDALFVLCHQALYGTRGAAITVAAIDHVHATLAWLGVGNVAGSLVRTSPGGPTVQSSVMQRGGVIGHQLPRALRPVRTSMQSGDVLLLGTDGLATGFADRPDLGQSAAALAQGILTHCAKGTDDALVLVARYRGRPR